MQTTIKQDTSPLKLVHKQFNFKLPDDLQCALPTEERGISRDEVKLLVSTMSNDQIVHSQFKNLEAFLRPGDVLVVNTSGTLKAALEAWRPNGQLVRIHFSNQLKNGQWLVEVRQIINGSSQRLHDIAQGEILALKHGGSIQLDRLYYSNTRKDHLKLWMANLQLPIELAAYFDYYGMPIRYHHTKAIYPQRYYQTAFARELGSAEMPSAGRAFTPELITRLVSKGILFAPILLHTGVASLEIDERPYEEYYEVPESSAAIINLAKSKGQRIIAVGTTAVRAIETVSQSNGKVHAETGWTDTFITPERGLYTIDALLTGFHEPRASHLLMLEALSGQEHLKHTYSAALEEKYQWHEFGDLHLIMP